MERANVPHDARAVTAGADGLVVVLGDLDGPHPSAVFFHGGLHALALFAKTEHPDLTLRTPGDHTAAVGSESERSHPMEVSVVDDVHETTGLGVEGTDFSVVPATENALAIGGEGNAVAFDVGNLNSKQFLSIVGVPNADVREGTGGEDVRVADREGYIVDFVVVTGIAELGVEVFSVHPVDVGQGSAAEKVAVVSSKSHGGYFSHHIGFAFEFHILDGQFIQGTVASTDENIAVGKLAQGGDSLAEKLIEGSEALEKGPFDGYFQDIAGGGSAVGVLVVFIDDGTGELALDVAEVHVETFDFFVCLVHSDDLNAVGQHGDEFFVVVLEVL